MFFLFPKIHGLFDADRNVNHAEQGRRYPHEVDAPPIERCGHADDIEHDTAAHADHYAVSRKAGRNRGFANPLDLVEVLVRLTRLENDGAENVEVAFQIAANRRTVQDVNHLVKRKQERASPDELGERRHVGVEDVSCQLRNVVRNIARDVH